jgi:hypothetical protein
MARRTAVLLLVGIAALAGAAPRKDALVFACGNRTAPAISSADLRRIFLGRTTRWPDGRRIVLAVRPGSTAAGRAFYARIVEMSEIDFSRLWLGNLFRGDVDSAPRVIGPPDEVRRFLAQTPDGLTVLLASEIDPRDTAIRPVPVDGRLPGAPGYPYPLP